MSTAEIVERTSTTESRNWRPNGFDYVENVPTGVKEPKCECKCHNKSILGEVLDWLSYKKNIHIKCLECRCFG